MARQILGYESRREPLLGRWQFAPRLAANCGVAAVLIALSLVGGMCGYWYFEGMSWIDVFANASMILSGTGPLSLLNTWAGKLFAGIYAIYSGLVLILASGVILAPLFHRVLHSFHLESEQDE